MLQLAIIKLYLLTLYVSKSAGMYMWFATFGSAHFLTLIWKHLRVCSMHNHSILLIHCSILRQIEYSYYGIQASSK